MPVLKTLVGTETKTRFRRMAKARDLSESELLRAVVLAVTGEDVIDSEPVTPDTTRTEIERMTVRMSRFLLEGAAARAKAKGMATSRWVAALVQSHLTRQPVMTQAELVALQTCSRELAAIGRNINQIAHALNSAFQETDRVKLEKLEELGHAVAASRGAIRSLVRASQDAWEAGNDGLD